MREKPDDIILHIGTNDLNSDSFPDLDLAVMMKINSQNGSTLNIMMCNESKWTIKAILH